MSAGRSEPAFDRGSGETGALAIYAGTAVSVNLTATSMPTALNLRVWDVPGAGGFLLTELLAPR